MARLARVVAPDIPHHITQRGNARRPVFFSDADRRVYLELLAAEAAQHDLTVLGYCLMTNHVHVIAIPRRLDSMALTFRYAHGRYATYLNALQRNTGHVWQGRYYSCALDEPHLWQAMRYIELNPVQAGMVSRPDEWPWSSARLHCGESHAGADVDLALWRRHWTAEEWSAFLSIGTSDAEANAIRRNTHTGRPLGSRSFVENLERSLDRPLLPRRALSHSPEDQGQLW